MEMAAALWTTTTNHMASSFSGTSPKGHEARSFTPSPFPSSNPASHQAAASAAAAEEEEDTSGARALMALTNAVRAATRAMDTTTTTTAPSGGGWVPPSVAFDDPAAAAARAMMRMTAGWDFEPHPEMDERRELAWWKKDGAIKPVIGCRTSAVWELAAARGRIVGCAGGGGPGVGDFVVGGAAVVGVGAVGAGGNREVEMGQHVEMPVVVDEDETEEEEEERTPASAKRKGKPDATVAPPSKRPKVDFSPPLPSPPDTTPERKRSQTFTLRARDASASTTAGGAWVGVDAAAGAWDLFEGGELKSEVKGEKGVGKGKRKRGDEGKEKGKEVEKPLPTVMTTRSGRVSKKRARLVEEDGGI